MEEENNRSSGVLGDNGSEHSKPVKNGGRGNRGEKKENNAEQKRASSDNNSDFAVGKSSRGKFKASESKTLSSVHLSEGDFPTDFDESSHLLSEVPVEYSLVLQPLQPPEELKDQVKAGHGESFKGLTGASTKVQIQLTDGSSKIEVSPTSVTQPIFSIPNPSQPQQKLRPIKNGKNVPLTERDKQNSPDPKPSSIRPVLKTPDGYNWRKYGQKQVKSPEGSRSYYRCTFSDCFAKKIECCDRSNHLVGTVYRSHHTHDPPQKLSCTKENISLAIVPYIGSNDTNRTVICSNESVQANMSKQPLIEPDEMREAKKQESSDSDETTEINIKEYVDGAECNKRQKRTSTDEVESPSKPVKKPKYVVHAAGDVGISGDGYRWRKYGQKMVKGNPHPRNYYRCTSVGCPVRKHIESAVDNTNAVVITYKGVHDHDTPVPKKRNSPKNTCSPVTLDDSRNESKKSRTQWSADKECEMTAEPLSVVRDETPGSTTSVSSIGFEIKPC